MAKSTLTAAARKKGQQKRNQIIDLTMNMALRENPAAKTVTKTIKVRTVEGKLKKSMAAYRNAAEKVVNKAEIEADRRKKAEAAQKRAATLEKAYQEAYQKGVKAGGKTCGK